MHFQQLLLLPIIHITHAIENSVTLTSEYSVRCGNEPRQQNMPTERD